MNALRFSIFALLGATTLAAAQEPANPATPPDRPPQDAPQPGGPPDERRPGFGGPPMQQEIKLVEKFDKDSNERLDNDERRAARDYLNKERAEGRLGRGMGFGGRRGRGPDGGGPRPDGAAPDAPRPDGTPPGPQPPPGGGFPGFGGPRENRPPVGPGPKLSPSEVKSYRAMPLYDAQALRTFFLEFENADWEKELMDFHGTDVEVPAKLIVDGKAYDGVVGSSRVDLQACKLEYSIVSPK